MNRQADAVAITGGRFSAVGRMEDILPTAAESTRVIDLNGSRVMPGLIDSHMHVIRGGLTTSSSAGTAFARSQTPCGCWSGKFA
jgi:predicted amidohydrolase YtcJ